jgi:hypothetical protein
MTWQQYIEEQIRKCGREPVRVFDAIGFDLAAEKGVNPIEGSVKAELSNGLTGAFLLHIQRNPYGRRSQQQFVYLGANQG